MGCVAGLGLLGLLITVAIIGVLAARSMSDVSDSPAGDVIRNRGGASSTAAPEGGAVTPGAGDSPQAASCATERSTIETAAQAFELTVGSPPPDLQAVVDSGLLVPTDVPFRHEIGPDGAVVGTGACAGG